MKNLRNATMESSILHELAAFDIRAPIKFTISFEDDDETDEVTVKTENVLDDDIHNQDTVELPYNEFVPKQEIKEELPETTEEIPTSNDLISDNQTEQTISKEITTFQTEIIQNETNICNDQRKRKQELLQIHKNKSAKKESPQENVSNHDIENHDRPSNHDKENENHEDLISSTNFTHQETDTSQLNPTIVASSAAVPSSIQEWERNRHKSYILRCLAAVSENMRITMEAFLHFKQYNTPYDWFRKQKMRCFDASYNTVVKLLLPERQNQVFIKSFINGTHQHALKISPLSNCCIQDYAILLMDLLSWADEKEKLKAQTAGTKENTVHPPLTASNSCQGLVLESTCNKSDTNNFHTGEKTDAICIFSSGSPGKEISINIDPNLKQYLSKPKPVVLKKHKSSVIQTPKKSSIEQVSQNTLPQSQISLQSQQETQTNNKNKHLQELLQRPPRYQPFLACMPNGPETNMQSHLYPEMYKYMCNFNSVTKEKLTTNGIETKQINTGLPQVQNTLEIQNRHRMPEQSRHPLPQSMPSQQMLPQSQQSENAAHRHLTNAPPTYGPLSRPGPPTYGPSSRPEAPTYCSSSRPVPPPCGPSSRPEPPTYGPASRPEPPTYGPASRPEPPTYGPASRPEPPTYSPSSRPGPPAYGPSSRPAPPPFTQSTWIPPFLPTWQQGQQNSQHVQPNNGQAKHMQQLGQPQHHMLPQCGQFQQVQEQLQPARQNGQLPMRQSQPQPQSQLPQHLSPHVSTQNGQSFMEHFREWHEGLKDLHQPQGQTQPQIHKSAPRSTSTDSGFISPLNFNASPDQTEPPVPAETETSTILITHVTSLNPKVPFIAEGTCVVCNTTTKKVCMGCMKIYYCTYECQLQAWPTHGPDCCSIRTAQHDSNAGRNKVMTQT